MHSEDQEHQLGLSIACTGKLRLGLALPWQKGADPSLKSPSRGSFKRTHWSRRE